MHHAKYCVTLVEVNILDLLFSVRLVSNRDLSGLGCLLRLSVASHVQGLARARVKSVLH